MGERLEPNGQEPSIIDTATLLVIEKECAFLTYLEQHYEFLLDLVPQSEAHMKGCGCHQCALQHEAFLQRVEQVRDEFENEYYRVNFIGPDEEEQLLFDYASQKLDDRRKHNKKRR